MISDDCAPSEEPLPVRYKRAPLRGFVGECGLCGEESLDLSDLGTIKALCPRCRGREFYYADQA